MKNITLFIATFVAFLFASNSAESAGTPPDSRVVARAFALQTPDYYYLSGSFVYDSNSWVSFEGRVNLDLEIVELTVGGELAWSEVDGRALPAFPFLDVEVETLFFHLRGREESNRNYLSYGSTVLHKPKAGDPIIVELHPATIDHIFEFEAPDGVDERDLEMVHADFGYRLGWYDVRFNAFVIQLNVLNGEVPFEIIDRSTGVVFHRGIVAPFDEAPEEIPNAGVVNVRMVGGVEWVRFDNRDHHSFDNQTFNGQTTYGGNVVSSKSYFFEGDEDSRSVKFQYSGSPHVRILVEEVTERGPMEVLGDFVPQTDDEDPNQGHLWFSIPGGSTSVVVTIMGNSQNDVVPPFHLWFNRGERKG